MTYDYGDDGEDCVYVDTAVHQCSKFVLEDLSYGSGFFVIHSKYVCLRVLIDIHCSSV